MHEAHGRGAAGGGLRIPRRPLRAVHADREGAEGHRVQRSIRRPGGDERLPLLDSDFVEICHGIADWEPLAVEGRFATLGHGMQVRRPGRLWTEPKAGPPDRGGREGGREGRGLEVVLRRRQRGERQDTHRHARAPSAMVGIAPDLEKAEADCERALRHVRGEAIYVRHDIGRRR